ncbi:MAG: S-methyl-5-thioribose-1-phosphate isomerase [Acidobacteriota bacterium]|nr:MAG: S-methyl-5-thioribose-1-phosphate isomerase [Acidobacteriota bacterium]
MITPIKWENDALLLLDQRILPHEEAWIRCESATAVAEAIRTMVVRGAPAIGVAAAYGMALAARRAAGASADELRKALEGAASTLLAARPTAVNLSWAVERVRSVFEKAVDERLAVEAIASQLTDEAQAIHAEDIDTNRSIGQSGSVLIPDGARVLTHCNAGGLATAGYGTALGVIRAAHEEGKKVTVIADETRPFLQGARLTAWELQKDGISVQLITDSMAGAMMARGEVDVVVVGADRIAHNGDVANKIGTYVLAVLARRHGVPFYVAAPTSTIDPDTPNGSAIPIEERDPSEVLEFAGRAIAPEGVSARHLAFDVTPSELVTAIITERGIARPPWESSIAHALGLDPEPQPELTAAETEMLAEAGEGEDEWNAGGEIDEDEPPVPATAHEDDDLF